MKGAKKDYSPTLLLPRTDFPMRANLAKREPNFIRFWDENRIYYKAVEKRRGKEAFILHDGPPYANEDIHIGHVLNKVLKDIIVRVKLLEGYYSPYVPGWDTHGLPIEYQVEKKYGLRKDTADPIAIRKKCKEHAEFYINRQREQFKRLGVIGDWENPYVTFDPKYEAVQIRAFGKFVEDGHVYRGKKPVYWCPHCKTALAEAEVEYKDKRSPSLYVRFPVVEPTGPLADISGTRKAYVVIWTTTPWTLPADRAVTVHPDYVYAVVEVEGDAYIVAERLLSEVAKILGWEGYRVLGRLKGTELEGTRLEHPLFNMTVPVVLGDFVTLEEGTGLVHTAPGHGLEDYEVGVKYGLEISAPLDDNGIFTEEAEKYKGLFYADANEVIVEDLRKSGKLLWLGEVTHSYPHCWRCKNPVVFRATEQWFISVRTLRDKAIEEIEKVVWIPPWSKNRILSMVQERSDWCISRQRVWGVPIPAFYCENCGKPVITRETVEHFAKIVEKEGTDAWWTKKVEELLPEGFACPHCGGKSFRKETSTMDVWFDSGVSHLAVLETRPELRWPSEMYLEGTDQHRGWFQSALWTSVALKGRAPYKYVLTHGFVVDEQGRKMSKSLGNVIAPKQVIDKYGADILRLWVASSDYSADVGISENILAQLAEAYRKIRNTFRFMLGNLFDFDPEKHMLPVEELEAVDRWALAKFEALKREIRQAYDSYEFHKVYHKVVNFLSVTMSAVYLDLLKERLYVYPADSKERRSAQTAIYRIAKELAICLSPILAFTMEEVWQRLPGRKEESVILTDFPSYDEGAERWKDVREIDAIMEVREDVVKAAEVARQAGTIGHTLEAKVKIAPKTDTLKQVLERYRDKLAEIFIASEVEVVGNLDEGIDGEVAKVAIEHAEGKKCARCWRWSKEVGKDAEYPDLCPFCAEIVRKYYEGGL